MTPSWRSSQDSGNLLPWFIVRGMAGHRWAATWRDTRGRGCGGAPPRPLQVQRRPSPSTWRQAGPGGRVGAPYAEDGASRLSPPCCSEGGHEVGGPPNLCPRLQSPPCWLPRSPLPFAAAPPSRRVAGSPSGPAPAPAGGSWTEVPSTSCGCGFLGPSQCRLRAKDTPVTQETPGIQELSQQGVWTGTSRYPLRCFTPRGARVPPPKLLPAAGSRGLWANWCFKACGDCGGPGPVLG